MNLFTSDLFTPAMLDGLAPLAPRSYRAPAFGRRYGRATATPVHVAPLALLTPRAAEAGVDDHALFDYDLAA